MNYRHPFGFGVFAILLALLLDLQSATAKEDESGLPKATPEQVGMNADGLAKIPARMKEFVEAGKISGAVTLVAKDGKIVHLEAIGLLDVASKAPMKEDTIFAIASMTKPITATALMILVDEGKIKLNDPVAKYIPQFKQAKLKSGDALSRAITVFDCLTHTSGLVGDQQCPQSLEATGNMLAQRPLGFQPGQRWQYSPGLNVIGRLIELAAGQPFERFLQERIFHPLGMKDTTFTPTAQQKKRIVTLYKPGKKKSSLQAATHWINDLSQDRPPNPSGGLFSTAADMARFYQAILNGGELDGKRIVSKVAVKKMTSPQTGDLKTGFTPGNCWGLGWCIVRQPQGVSESLSEGTYGHGGAFGTQGWVDPQRKMIYVLMIQRTGFGNSDGSNIRRTLHKLTVESLRE